MGQIVNSRFVTISLAGLLLIALFGPGCEDGIDDEPPIGGEGDATADAGPSDAMTSDTSSGDAGGGDTVGGGDTGGADGSGADGSSGDGGMSCSGSMCGGSCCPAEKSCVEGRCLAACSGTRCGDKLEKCCTGGDLCIGDGCATPHGDCERTEDCDKGQICQASVGKCISRKHVDVCEYKPPEGEFSPQVDCNWSPADDDPHPERIRTEAAPTVANVTDDNGDGETDTRDIPDLVFLSHETWCCNQPSTIRIVDGECNEDGTMTTLGSISKPAAASSAGIAVGDLTGNGVPEIVSVTLHTGNPQGTAAWTRTKADGSKWKLLWHNKTYPTFGTHTRGGATISLADLEADGTPDVIIGNVALNGKTGKLKWDGQQTAGGNGGIGNNAFLGPSSSVADIDLDGKREVAAGNTLYDHDGTPLWTYTYKSSNSGCQGGLNCDGFSAMADFDDDPEGEVVIVRLGEVFVIGHDGKLQWTHKILKDDCSNNEAGPPTVADFDGDGEPEIGTAAADFYTVLDPECDQDPVPNKCKQRGILWATPNEDCSSRVTASSVFDFEGDGKAEMVYADEQNFYILDGTTGQILHKDDRHRHNTRIEMPLVADVDNDGNSEVVVGAADGPNVGINVWADEDDNWVRTRRIWNQHAYSVTNIEEDGTIPTKPNPNWSNDRLNNFRQNQQPAGLFDAPDLVVTSIDASDVSCVGGGKATFEVRVENDGALGVAPGVPVELVVDKGGTTHTIGQWTTTKRLLPGQHEIFKTEWTVPQGWVDDGFELRANVDPDENVNECEENNNEEVVDSKSTIELKAPAIDITSLSADNSRCSRNGKIQISFDVENNGKEAAPAGVPIRVSAIQGSNETVLETVTTSGELAPGDSESFSLEWKVDPSFAGEAFDIETLVDPDETIFNCDASNRNSVETQCMLGG